MKIKEIIEMSTDELLTKKRDLRQESLHLRLQQQSGQLEQPSRLRLLRREEARIETVRSKRTKETKESSRRSARESREGGGLRSHQGYAVTEQIGTVASWRDRQETNYGADSFHTRRAGQHRRPHGDDDRRDRKSHALRADRGRDY